MTNKLKKEIEDFVGEMCEDGDLKVNSDDFYKFIKNIKKQAKLSQKQEDDERFEKMIDELLERSKGWYGHIPKGYISEQIEELKSKLNGEKETFEEHIKHCGCCDDGENKK